MRSSLFLILALCALFPLTALLYGKGVPRYGGVEISFDSSGSPAYPLKQENLSFTDQSSFFTISESISGTGILSIYRVKDGENDSPTTTKRRKGFHSDLQVPKPIRVVDADYHLGKYLSRGHLTPNLERGRNTFIMTNVVPQEVSFNNGIWGVLERCVHDEWEYQEGVNATIFTGAVHSSFSDWDSWRKSDKTGKQIKVPSHLYKIILLDKASASGGDSRDFDVLAFLMPNRAYQAYEVKSMASFIVSIKEIEKLTGLRFTEIPPKVKLIKPKKFWPCRQLVNTRGTL